jgi:putative methyltransferase (TIGR04325 family)
MSRASRILARVLPPIITDAIRARRRRSDDPGRGYLEFLPSGWPISFQESPGWNHESVAASQLRSWPAFLERVAAPNPVSGITGIDDPPTAADYALHNTIMVFAYVLGRAAQGATKLSILDWGSGLGQYSVLAHALFPELSIEYHCRELPILARHGRHVLPNVRFHDDDAGALSRSYDVVIASGSLQYSRDWAETLTSLVAATRRYLYVTRLPLLRRAKSFTVMQRPAPGGYETSYRGWFLNRLEFLDKADLLGVDLVREFLIFERSSVKNAPEQADYRGFLFSKRLEPSGDPRPTTSEGVGSL